MRYEKLNIAVCDDSQIDREIVVDLLNDYFDKKDLVCDIFQFTSGEELLSSNVNDYNLFFLDLIMPGCNGIELANKILETNANAKFILCSSSTDFVEESYNLNVMYYFIKPLNIIKFNIVLDKFLESYTNLQTVQIKIGRSNETFFLSSIYWFEPFGHHTFVYTSKGVFESSEAFNELFDRFQKFDFIKTSRFAAVALKHVKKVETNYLILDDKTSIPFSRSCKEQAMKEYSNYRLLNHK